MNDVLLIGTCLIGILSLGFLGYKIRTTVNHPDGQLHQIQDPLEKDINTAIDLYLTNSISIHPQSKLLNVIRNAKSSLDIAIYSLTDDEVVDEIIRATKRGIEVRIITDSDQSKSNSQPRQLRRLSQAGIAIRIAQHMGAMHLKVTIADKMVFTLGSYNYTNSARTRNDEILAVIKSRKLAKELFDDFDSRWNDVTRYRSLMYPSAANDSKYV